MSTSTDSRAHEGNTPSAAPTVEFLDVHRSDGELIGRPRPDGDDRWHPCTVFGTPIGPRPPVRTLRNCSVPWDWGTSRNAGH